MNQSVTSTTGKLNVLASKIEKNDFQESIQHNFNVIADMYGETLAAEQLKLEHEAYEMGEARFIKQLNRQILRGEFADNATAKPALNDIVPKLSAAISAFVEEGNAKGKRGRKHVALAPLMQIDADYAALIVIKSVFVCLSKEMNIQNVASRIGTAIEDEIRYGRIRTTEGDYFKKYIKNALDKRNGAAYRKAYMQAVETSMIAAGTLSEDDKWSAWDKETTMHLGIKLIELLIQSTGLVEIHRINQGTKNDAETIRISDTYIDYFAGRARSLAGISPVMQPCIIPPKPWVDVSGGGYWAKGRKPIPMIRTGTRKALERYADVDMPIVYDALNAIQNTAWRVNKDVLTVVNAMADFTQPKANIPSVDKSELPEKLLGMDEDDSLLKQWKKQAAAVYRRERARQSRRVSFEFIVGQANKFAKYGAIWFPHNLDWRGRVYSIPMFNPQGNDVNKGLLEFAEGFPLGKEGARWLAIHGANCAGYDKASLDARVQWVIDNEQLIIDSAVAPLDCLWWAEQDSPFCFLAFCMEWAGYKREGESFVSHLPVAFDGTCSGIQHFSAMLRDEVGGEAVNLRKGLERKDIYGIVAEKVKVEISKLLLEGSSNEIKTYENKKTGEITERLQYGTKEIAKWWDEYGVTRSVTKRSVMTLAYGSKEYGFADQVFEDIVMPAIDEGKGHMFLDAAQASRFMAKLIWDAVSVTVIAAVKAMEWLQGAAGLLASKVIDKKTDEVLKDCLPVHWITPAGFPVWQEYRKVDQKRLDILFLGTFRLQPTINVRERDELDARKQASGIAPNFVHSQDASHLQLTVRKAKEDHGITSFAMIHDSFGTHATKAGLLYKAIRETMVDTYSKYDVIQEFYNQFADQLHESQLEKMPEVPAKGTLDLNEILEAEFAFS